MARVASCPNCNHELLVPDHADLAASATCPECSAHFQLKDVSAREIPALVLADTEPLPKSADVPQASAPTTDEFSSPAFESSTHDAPPPAPVTESQEEAAQRIEAWFRSAKTLSDLPKDGLPLNAESAEPGSPPDWAQADDASRPGQAPIQHEYAAPSSREDNDATIDMSADDPRLADLNSDFALDAASEALPDKPAWDDTQRMDQLLANIENEPVDEFIPSDQETSANEPFAPAEAEAGWSPDVPLAMTPGVKETRRKRSFVTTALFTVVGGIVGLALGYYALLWIQGPKIDFLDLAKYIPKAALPSSFKPESESPSVAPPVRQEPVAATEPGPADTSSKAVSKSDDQPAEKQAAFAEPVKAPKGEPTPDDRYATPSAKSENPSSALHEPAPLAPPLAKPIVPQSAPKQPETIHFASAPSFSAADVSTALQAAKDAQPKLVAGSLGDSKEVQQAKGRSFMALADLAQKATFAAQSSAGSAMSPEVELLFRQTLSDKHTRDEVAQIAQKWMDHPNRPQNGIFFAGTVTQHEVKGSVTECTVDLGTGQPLMVIIPANEAAALISNRPVAVVGAIVEKPADQIQGYSGNATKAVVANALIPLE
jgi:hypothetical protein